MNSNRIPIVARAMAVAAIALSCSSANGQPADTLKPTSTELAVVVRNLRAAQPKPVFREGPRKVIVGTTMFAMYPNVRPFVSVEKRLDEISQRIDEIAQDAHRRHGRGLDIAVFPESSLNARTGTIIERSVELNEAVRSRLGAKARQHNTYLVVCFNLLEDRETCAVYNASVLFDRRGEVAGIYRKVFVVPSPDGTQLEGGKRPGNEFPVFDTDFGRIGMAICYDMGFDDIFESFARDGVELIVWPTMSPQTLLPRAYARRFGYYIVSSTPRDNASIFDPLGEIAAQTTVKESVLTYEIDLDYRIVHFQANLRDGEVLREKYGERVGFRYLTREDSGIFWSNDHAVPIARMLEATGIRTDDYNRRLARSTRLKVLAESAEGVGPPAGPAPGAPPITRSAAGLDAR